MSVGITLISNGSVQANYMLGSVWEALTWEVLKSCPFLWHCDFHAPSQKVCTVTSRTLYDRRGTSTVSTNIRLEGLILCEV